MPWRNGEEKKRHHSFCAGTQQWLAVLQGDTLPFPRSKPDRRKIWPRNINRGARVQKEGSIVCDHHFEPFFFERTFKTTIKSELVEIPRKRRPLQSEAIPTIIPDAPKCVSKTHQSIFKIRKLNGNNDHPTPTQFLAAINALAFYKFTKPPKTVNCSPEVVNSLLGRNKTTPEQCCPGPIDALDQLWTKRA